MGRTAAADAFGRKLRALKPVFPQKAREYVGFLLLDDDLAAQILASLNSLRSLSDTAGQIDQDTAE